jgi:hypothetical protein
LLIFFPDYPETTWWLTPSERLLAVARGREGEVTPLSPAPETTSKNAMKPPNVSFRPYSIIESVKNPRLWSLSIIFYLVWTIFDASSFLSPHVTITSFDVLPSELRSNSSAIHKLILEKEKASLHSIFMSAIPFFLGGILSIPLATHSDSTSERVLHAAIPLFFSLGGLLFLVIVPPNFAGGGSARYFTGILPAVSGVLVSLPPLIAYAIESIAGDTSRSISAFIFSAFGLSFGQMILLSNDLFSIPDEPAYTKGLLCLSGLMAASITGLFAMRYVSRPENQIWGKPPG